jgi:hypothetical protein
MSHPERAITDGHANDTWVGTVRCAVRARKAGATIPAALPPGTSQRDVPATDGRAQALEREANIIADLPRIQRRKAQGQRLNAKGIALHTVSAFSLSRTSPARQQRGAHHTIKKCHQTLWAGGKLSPPAAL